MTYLQLSNAKAQFERYVGSFTVDGGELPPLLLLKADHCQRVAAETRGLSSDLGWSLPEQNSAEAIGLLHDIGRFSQFAEFSTFSDSASIDHGQRGATVIEQAGWLMVLQTEERLAILNGIRYHNCLTIPGNIDERHLALLHLVRDADKLDIFRIVLDAVERDGFRDLPSMLPHISLERTPSPQLLDEIILKKRASLNKVRTLADFLLMQLAWAYDLNYAPSCRRFHDRCIRAKILKHIKGDPRIQAFGQEVDRFISNRISR